MMLGENAQLGLDTILRKQTKGIPSWLLNPMEHAVLEKYAGVEPGAYKKDYENVYLQFQRNIGTCMLDQYIPDNPLTMGDQGYEGTAHGSTTGAEEIICDGIVIDSPEAVVEHMERFVFPSIIKATEIFDEAAYIKAIIDDHNTIQEKLGPDILKTLYGFTTFPCLSYGSYGYVHYFCAFALYPEVMEKHFSLQADYATKANTACVKAQKLADLPLVWRLDHDMADSRGTLVNIKALDDIWFPHFTRCVKPLTDSDILAIWHCDGNLMDMVPRLLDAGLKGFQGFQYEDGMDYKQICDMKTSEGEELFIIGGVSVTRTLPFGTPADVKKEMEFLVEYGPKHGLALGGSSSITPGVPEQNMSTFIEGLQYYRTHGRS